MRKIARLVTIKEILSRDIEVGYLIKTIGRVLEITKNEYLKLVISHNGSEILVRIYDEPVGIIDYILSHIEPGSYVLVIGYLKEVENMVYIVAKGIKKLDRELYNYYLLRHKLNVKSS